MKKDKLKLIIYLILALTNVFGAVKWYSIYLADMMDSSNLSELLFMGVCALTAIMFIFKSISLSVKLDN